MKSLFDLSRSRRSSKLTIFETAIENAYDVSNDYNTQSTMIFFLNVYDVHRRSSGVVLRALPASIYDDVIKLDVNSLS